MKREFKAGDIIFHEDYLDRSMHGFGRILKDAVVENADDTVLVSVNDGGKSRTMGDFVYKLSEGMICPRCRCVLLREHHITNDMYPHFCPDCDENFFSIETIRVSYDAWRAYLKEIKERFKTE